MDGIHAVNGAGRTAKSPATSVTVDATSPTTPAITSAADGDWIAGESVSLRWTAATDGQSGLDRYEVMLDSTVVQTLPASTTSTALPVPAGTGNGAHTFTVTAVDKVGNRGADAVSVVLGPVPPAPPPAPAAPTVTGASSSGGYAGGDLTVQWVPVADPNFTVTGYAVQVDGATVRQVAADTTSVVLPTLSTGAHAIRLTVRNAAALSAIGEPRSVLVDATAPSTPSILSPAEMSFHAVEPLLRWSTATDGHSGLARYEVAFDSTVVRTLPAGTTSTTLPFPAGTTNGMHTVTVTAVDNVGHESTRWRTIYVDRAAPDPLSITSPASGATRPPGRS